MYLKSYLNSLQVGNHKLEKKRRKPGKEGKIPYYIQTCISETAKG